MQVLTQRSIRDLYSMNVIQSTALEIETWEKFIMKRSQMQFNNTKLKLDSEQVYERIYCLVVQQPEDRCIYVFPQNKDNQNRS